MSCLTVTNGINEMAEKELHLIAGQHNSEVTNTYDKNQHNLQYCISCRSYMKGLNLEEEKYTIVVLWSWALTTNAAQRKEMGINEDLEKFRGKK